MRKKVFFNALPLSLLAFVGAEESATVLPDLLISSTPLEVAISDNRTGYLFPENDVAALVLAPQGGSLAQVDLQIRGSSFSSSGITIAGLALRNPQTEHFHADLPIASALLSRSQILTGIEQSLNSSGFLVGSIATDFSPASRRNLASLQTSEKGGSELSAFSQFEISENSPWFASVFFGMESLPGRDWRGNGMDALNFGTHVQYRRGDQRFDALAAWRERSFGAIGFYGVNPALSAFEEITDILLLARYEQKMGDDFFRISASRRWVEDDYLLDRNDPLFYRNQHNTTISSLNIDGVLQLNDSFSLLLFSSLEDERISSSGIWLGNPNSGLGKHNRQRYLVSVSPSYQIGDWVLTANSRLLAFSEGQAKMLWGLGIERSFSEIHKLHLGYTENLRQPSFTELNYESPASLGNQGLENETSRELELAFSSNWNENLNSRFAIFACETKNSVDWIKADAASRWTASDLGKVETYGFSGELGYRSENWLGGLFTQLLKKQKDAEFYSSRYVFDYPEARIGGNIKFSLSDRLQIDFSQTLISQISNPMRSGNSVGLLGSARASWLCASGNLISLGCENLWDDQFQVYPEQRSSGRSLFLRLDTSW